MSDDRFHISDDGFLSAHIESDGEGENVDLAVKTILDKGTDTEYNAGWVTIHTSINGVTTTIHLGSEEDIKELIQYLETAVSSINEFGEWVNEVEPNSSNET